MSYIPANNGWTCEHVSNTVGPCWKCAPKSGICSLCSRPLDDHEFTDAGIRCQSQRRKAAA